MQHPTKRHRRRLKARAAAWAVKKTAEWAEIDPLGLVSWRRR